jgi:Rod binding domain-containing protein
MNISPIQQRLDVSDVPPEQLANNSQLTEEQKIGEATRQFEALLLRQILENTQKTVIRSSFSDDSTSSTIYRDLVTAQLADSISRSGDLGLGKTLERQFTQSLRQSSLSETTPPADVQVAARLSPAPRIRPDEPAAPSF